MSRGYFAPFALVHAYDKLDRQRREIDRVCYEQFARQFSEMRREPEKKRREPAALVEAIRLMGIVREQE